MLYLFLVMMSFCISPISSFSVIARNNIRYLSWSTNILNMDYRSYICSSSSGFCDSCEKSSGNRIQMCEKNSHKKKSSSSSKKLKSLSPVYVPKSYNQKKYVELLEDVSVPLLVALGPAGCGKTMFACSHAIQSLQRGEIQKIIMTRPMVSVEDEEIGFLPGNLVSKMDPWTRPMFDIFSEYYSMTDLTAMIHSGVIDIVPLAFMRGRTFHKSFILADEMQNSSPSQMLMLTTRIGSGSKMVITGDLQQSDRVIGKNGLVDFLEKYRLYGQESRNGQIYDIGESMALGGSTVGNMVVNKNVISGGNGIRVVELNNADIQRSPIVTRVLDLYRDRSLEMTSATISVPALEITKRNNTVNRSVKLNCDGVESGVGCKNSTLNMDCALIPLRDEVKINKYRHRKI